MSYNTPNHEAMQVCTPKGRLSGRCHGSRTRACAEPPLAGGGREQRVGRLLPHTPPTAAACPKTSILPSSPPRNTTGQLSTLLPAAPGQPRLPPPPLRARSPALPARPCSPHPHPSLTASSALLAPLDTAALADPERVHTRWLLSVGASREMNSELESRRSKGGRRQRLSRAAMRGGRAALLRRTTMARGTRPRARRPRAPPGSLRRAPCLALRSPLRPLLPARARCGRARGALRLRAPQTFGAQNSERCAGGAGRGWVGSRLRPVLSRPPEGSLRFPPPPRPYPRSARAQPGWSRFPRGPHSGWSRRAQRFLRRPQPRSDRLWRGPRLVMRRRCRPAPPAPTPAATGKGDGDGRAGAPRTAVRRRDSRGHCGNGAAAGWSHSWARFSSRIMKLEENKISNRFCVLQRRKCLEAL